MTTPAPTPQPAQPAVPFTEAEDKQWASLAHLGGILFILPSLLIFLIARTRGPRTHVESKEALNWQINFLVIWIVVSIINGIVTAATAATSLYGFYAGPSIGSVLIGILLFLLWVGNAVLSVLGFIKVNGGGSYRYPFAVRFIK